MGLILQKLKTCCNFNKKKERSVESSSSLLDIKTPPALHGKDHLKGSRVSVPSSKRHDASERNERDTLSVGGERTLSLSPSNLSNANAPVANAVSTSNVGRGDLLATRLLVKAERLEEEIKHVSVAHVQNETVTLVAEIQPPPPPDAFPSFVTAPVEEMHKKLFIDVFQLLLDEGIFFNSKRNRARAPYEFVTPEELRKNIDLDLPNYPVSHTQLLHLIKGIIKYQPHLSHPMNLRQSMSGLDPYSCTSDLISTCTNSNTAMFIISTVLTLLEREVIRAICQLAGYDVNGDGHGTITPGSSMANGFAMAIALKEKFPAVKKGGLSSLQKHPCFFVSERSASVYRKCAIFQGLGTDSIVTVSVDSNDRMLTDDLKGHIQGAISRGWVPCMVVGTAGTSVTRAVDHLRKVADICKDFNLWFHVDGTYGGALLFSDTQRLKLKGIERSDSFTWSQQYLLNVATTCTSLTLPPRHDKKLNQTLAVGEGSGYSMYPLYDSKYDSLQNTMISCRRPEMFKFWMQWKAKGAKGLGQHIDCLFKNVETCLEEMEKREGFELLFDQFEGTNVCFYYIPLPYKAIPRGSMEYVEKISKLNVTLKKLLLATRCINLNYNEIPGRPTFLVLGLHNSVLTRREIVYALDKIKTCAEHIVNPKYTHEQRRFNSELLKRGL